MFVKTAGVAICIATFATSAVAQTNTFPASGKVGIGTLNPTATLSIHGADPFSYIDDIQIVNPVTNNYSAAGIEFGYLDSTQQPVETWSLLEEVNRGGTF